MRRRDFLKTSAAAMASVACFGFARLSAFAAENFPLAKPDSEWKKLLTAQQYNVLRQQGTEPAGTSPLDHFYDKGRYDCVACGTKLFSSDTKFNSHTGWPSFWQPLPDAVGTTTDTTMFMTRVEVHCAGCGGHLGHVFDDGPPPTHQRYCMNGVALKFISAR